MRSAAAEEDLDHTQVGVGRPLRGGPGLAEVEHVVLGPLVDLQVAQMLGVGLDGSRDSPVAQPGIVGAVLLVVGQPGFDGIRDAGSRGILDRRAGVRRGIGSSRPATGGFPSVGYGLGVLPKDSAGLAPSEVFGQGARSDDWAGASCPLLGPFLEFARMGIFGVLALTLCVVAAVQTEGHDGPHFTPTLHVIAR
jgi:hypothetical protein